MSGASSESTYVEGRDRGKAKEGLEVTGRGPKKWGLELERVGGGGLARGGIGMD